MTTLAELIREQMKQDDVLGNIKEQLIKALMANIRKEGKAHVRYVGGTEERVEEKGWDGTYWINIHYHKETALKMWLSEQGFRFCDTYAFRTGIRGLDITI